ncbi:MAG TPA: DinB family protein, partial [Rhodothermales bacterium]|nr:DinB family protein [Rhodothermales bacterium]
MNQISTCTDLRYPIGRFTAPDEITPEMRAGWIQDVAGAPRSLRKAVQGLSEEQLRTPYRPGGWTVRQVVHHLPDSHLNA